MDAAANYHKLSSLNPFIISTFVVLSWLCIKSHTEIQEVLGKVLFQLSQAVGRMWFCVVGGLRPWFSYSVWAGDILSCWRPQGYLARGSSMDH